MALSLGVCCIGNFQQYEDVGSRVRTRECPLGCVNTWYLFTISSKLIKKYYVCSDGLEQT